MRLNFTNVNENKSIKPSKFYPKLLKETYDKKKLPVQKFYKSLLEEKVDVIFGYPGGANMPFTMLYIFMKKLRHILVRHEQGATHAAEGYARITGRPGSVW